MISKSRNLIPIAYCLVSWTIFCGQETFRFSATSSLWIYFELQAFRFIRRTPQTGNIHTYEHLQFCSTKRSIEKFRGFFFARTLSKRIQTFRGRLSRRESHSRAIHCIQFGEKVIKVAATETVITNQPHSLALFTELSTH